ncbi:DNase I-like protein [Calocera cornea HHB12733]|uniref:DNase I-like protein n=1 Tax=Calocera cornea HHB12733 TaxID=1353952 RepID=A0A165ETZ5_9BASI|nr:DNase I-like protein [Calocera cornea HHB12733]
MLLDNAHGTIQWKSASPSDNQPATIAQQTDGATRTRTALCGQWIRLQALFPHHEDNPASPRNSLSDRLVPNLTISSPPPVRKIPEKSADSSPPHEHPFLKIKIITWNMHESLPHGDLRALLGSVPPHVPLEVRDGSLPPLPTDDDHPFHIVIVAGQECPTHSGIPMGLGATFKDRHKDREKQPEREASRRDKDREKERQRHSRNAKGDTNAFVPGTLSSWSAILEDWFQNGVGSMSGVQPALREASAHIKDLHPAPSMPMEASASAPAAMESAPENVWDLPTEDYHLGGPYLGWNIPEHGGTVTLSAEQARLRAGVKGPYVLLCKERLMGIYIAVFVQRDCRPLVKGYSTGTVTAGLIGGRVGNKGGAGVSINFAGVRLLFVNAHLAAHEGKVALRLANLHKIKNELEVDTFLPPNDPRLVSEDVTDRFDYTFVFGDLNFRLDLSRLHADWLISRRDYAQALEFDQLHKLIQEGKVDFQEEPPRFPPTYKYDVRRRSIRDAKRLTNMALLRIGKNMMIMTITNTTTRTSTEDLILNRAPSSQTDQLGLDPRFGRPTQTRTKMTKMTTTKRI